MEKNKVMDKLFELKVREEYGTELEENCSWYCINATTESGKKLETMFIMPERMNPYHAYSEADSIIRKRGLENFIPISTLSSDLRCLVESCCQSDNEMWYVEYEDCLEFGWTEDYVRELEKEVARLGIEEYFEFDLDYENADYIICVYGGIPSVINFYDERNYEIPSLQDAISSGISEVEEEFWGGL